MVMIKIKSLIVNILIPNAIGFIGGLIGNAMKGFKNIIKPSFTPPAMVFPVAWTILYTLMGISSYMIYESNNERKGSALLIYGIQLILNSLWSLFFFKLKMFLFASILILIILGMVIVMMYKYYKIKPLAAYLQIPYMLWLIFAFILSINVYMLNM